MQARKGKEGIHAIRRTVDRGGIPGVDILFSSDKNEYEYESESGDAARDHRKGWMDEKTGLLRDGWGEAEGRKEEGRAGQSILYIRACPSSET